MNEMMQRRIVLAGYLVQILSSVLIFGFPPIVLLAVLFPLCSLPWIKQPWLRSHNKWQLVTFGVATVLSAIATGLLAIGFSEINQTTTTTGTSSSVIGVGIWISIPIWLLYRYVRGLLFLGAQREFETWFH